MIIQEHLRADKLYECRTNGEHHIHVIIKDGEAVVYANLIDMISHQYLGDENVTPSRFAFCRFAPEPTR